MKHTLRKELLTDKKRLTEQRREVILYSLNYIYLQASGIETEHRIALVDTKFNNPLINNLSKRIMGDALRIMKELNVTVPEEQYAEDRMVQLHRLMKFFADKNTEELKEMNDRIEEETLALQLN